MRDFKEGRILPADMISALYEFLCEQGDQWTEAVDIYYNLHEFYGGEDPFGVKPEEFHDTWQRIQITDDIRYINESTCFHKIIICGKKGIKIANEEEAARYIKNMYAAIFRRLKRARAIEKKAAADGQVTLEKEVIRAFIESGGRTL